MTPEETAPNIDVLFTRAADHYNKRMGGWFKTTAEEQQKQFAYLVTCSDDRRFSGPEMGLEHVGLIKHAGYRGQGVYVHNITPLGLSVAAALRGKE